MVWSGACGANVMQGLSSLFDRCYSHDKYSFVVVWCPFSAFNSWTKSDFGDAPEMHLSLMPFSGTD